MLRNLMTAALVLALGLTAAGCANSTASARNWMDDNTAARGWQKANDQKLNDIANQRNYNSRSESWGPLSGGTYAANQDGQVRGYHNDAANNAAAARNAAKRAGNDIAHGAKRAGDDIAHGAKDAARSIGDAAEDALDNMKDAAKDGAEKTRDGINPNGQGTGLSGNTQ